MIDVERVKAESNGRWLGIYEHFGIDVGTGKHKPCPVCGGKDRFRCDNKTGNGDYICGQCGAGDGISLVQKVTGKPFLETLSEIAGIIGTVAEDARVEKPKTDPREALNKLWTSSTPLTGSDPASKYLHGRKLVLTPENVRFCPKCYESDTKKELPAMVARVQNKEGQPISIHRTYLDGLTKANIESPKKLMPATGPLQGAAIRLFQPGGMLESDILGVAEGIETAIAVAQIFGVACWALISTSIMVAFEPPEGIRHIIIYGDHDAHFAGHKAAYTLANKLFIKDYLVEVVIPEQVGDWADFNIKNLS